MNQLPHNRTGNPKKMTPDPRTVVVFDQDIVTFRILSAGNTTSLFFIFSEPENSARGGGGGGE